MARQSSAVLSPADKKAVITKTKADLKTAREALKEHDKAVSDAQKAFTKQHAAAVKAVATLVKDNTKALAAADKARKPLSAAVGLLDEALTAMTPTVSA